MYFEEENIYVEPQNLDYINFIFCNFNFVFIFLIISLVYFVHPSIYCPWLRRRKLLMRLFSPNKAKHVVGLGTGQFKGPLQETN